MRTLHSGPRFRGDFDMFAKQSGYLKVVQDNGFRLPADYLDFADQFESARQVLAATDQTTVPCNNDLLAANFVEDGDTHVADRLRVLRKQRPVLRTGQHVL